MKRVLLLALLAGLVTPTVAATGQPQRARPAFRCPFTSAQVTQSAGRAMVPVPLRGVQECDFVSAQPGVRPQYMGLHFARVGFDLLPAFDAAQAQGFRDGRLNPATVGLTIFRRGAPPKDALFLYGEAAGVERQVWVYLHGTSGREWAVFVDTTHPTKWSEAVMKQTAARLIALPGHW